MLLTGLDFSQSIKKNWAAQMSPNARRPNSK